MNSIKTTDFDYSLLDVTTAEKLQVLSDKAKKEYERHYIALANIIAEAHEVVARRDKQNNQYSENTFIDWCNSISITKDTAYRLLQVHEFINSYPKEQQAQLESKPISLLYSAAKPSAPTQLVEGVVNGDIETNAEYKKLLAKLQEKDEEIMAIKKSVKKEAKKQAEIIADDMLDEVQTQLIEVGEKYEESQEQLAEIKEANQNLQEYIEQLKSKPLEVQQTQVVEDVAPAQTPALQIDELHPLLKSYAAQIEGMTELLRQQAVELDYEDFCVVANILLPNVVKLHNYIANRKYDLKDEQYEEDDI